MRRVILVRRVLLDREGRLDSVVRKETSALWASPEKTDLLVSPEIPDFPASKAIQLTSSPKCNETK